MHKSCLYNFRNFWSFRRGRIHWKNIILEKYVWKYNFYFIRSKILFRKPTIIPRNKLWYTTHVSSNTDPLTESCGNSFIFSYLRFILLDMYESILVLDNVRSEHYSTIFRCEAANKYGVATHDIEVIIIWIS